MTDIPPALAVGAVFACCALACNVCVCMPIETNMQVVRAAGVKFKVFAAATFARGQYTVDLNAHI